MPLPIDRIGLYSKLTDYEMFKGQWRGERIGAKRSTGIAGLITATALWVFLHMILVGATVQQVTVPNLALNVSHGESAGTVEMEHIQPDSPQIDAASKQEMFSESTYPKEDRYLIFTDQSSALTPDPASAQPAAAPLSYHHGDDNMTAINQPDSQGEEPSGPSDIELAQSAAALSRLLDQTAQPGADMRSTPSPQQATASPNRNLQEANTNNINCTEEAIRAEFSIPRTSRGAFYMGLFVPTSNPIFCKFCGCNSAFYVLGKGVAALYNIIQTLEDGSFKNTVPTYERLAELGMPPEDSGGNIVAVNMSSGAALPREDGSKPNTARFNGLGSGGQVGFDATWHVSPVFPGDYLIHFKVSNQEHWRWVTVDMEPPRMVGALYATAVGTAPCEPTAASYGLDPEVQRFLLLTINFTEPVRPFQLDVSSDCSHVIWWDCYAAHDAAARLAGMARVSLMQQTTLEASPPPPQQAFTPYRPTLEQALMRAVLDGELLKSQNPWDDLAMSAITEPYVQSCVAVMNAADGSSSWIGVSPDSAGDLSGNNATKWMTMNVDLTDDILPSVEKLSVTFSTMTAASLLGTSLAAASMAFRSTPNPVLSLLQAAFPFQMLTMTANLAIPGVSYAYRQVARCMRWGLLAVKNNVPLLDKAMRHTEKDVNITKPASARLGIDPHTVLLNNISSSSSPSFPPGRSLRRRLASQSQPKTTLASRSARALQEWLVSIGKVPAVPSPLLSSRNPAAIIARTVNGDNTMGGAGGSQFARTETTFQAKQGVLMDESGLTSISSFARHLLNAGSEAPIRWGDMNIVFSTDMQDLIYTYVVAMVVMGIAVIVHMVFVKLHRILVRDELPSVLWLPRTELAFMGPLLVAITFYGAMALANTEYVELKHSRLAAMLALVLFVIPYLAFIWWLTVCRWYLVERGTLAAKLYQAAYRNHAASGAHCGPTTESGEIAGMKTDDNMHNLANRITTGNSGAIRTSPSSQLQSVLRNPNRRDDSPAGNTRGKTTSIDVGERSVKLRKPASRLVRFRMENQADEPPRDDSKNPVSPRAQMPALSTSATLPEGLLSYGAQGPIAGNAASSHAAAGSNNNPYGLAAPFHMTDTSHSQQAFMQRSPQDQYYGAQAIGGQGTGMPIGEGQEEASPFATAGLTEGQLEKAGMKTMPLYPGKGLPFGQINFRKDSWVVRLGITPSIKFMSLFEFLFVHSIGELEEQDGRETKPILSATALSSTYMLLYAAIFGAYGLRNHSLVQPILLIVASFFMLFYLLVWRPFIDRIMLGFTVTCHVLQIMLLCCALTLFNVSPNMHSLATKFMLVCFFLTAVAIILYELYILGRLIKAAWDYWFKSLNPFWQVNRLGMDTAGTSLLYGPLAKGNQNATYVTQNDAYVPDSTVPATSTQQAVAPFPAVQSGTTTAGGGSYAPNSRAGMRPVIGATSPLAALRTSPSSQDVREGGPSGGIQSRASRRE